VSLSVGELRSLEPGERVAHALRTLRDAGVVSADVDPGWVRRILDGTDTRVRSLARCRPEVFPGRLALFLPGEYDMDAEALAVWSESSSLWWRAYSAEPAVVHVYPGHHATMASGEHAEGMASRLRAMIDESLYDLVP
jgi:hypothetical protein